MVNIMRVIPTVLRGILVAVLASTSLVVAQVPTPPTPPAQEPINPDASVVGAIPEKPKTPAELRVKAWEILSDALADEKHEETRTQALAALGLMGGNTRSLQMIKDAMKDKDIDIRVAAALAAGQTKSPNITTELRGLLDDKEPAVAFVAALTLWKMHDRSGEDILTAVADGERKTSANLMNGTKHSINKELHDPSAMAKYGATQGAYMLLGPFGIGLTALEYLHKNGGDTGRVSAIDAIAQNHTNPIRLELIGATVDKDLGVRAAACKALARYHDKDVPATLAKVFDDTKPPVRLTAAAAYLISTGAVVGSPVESEMIPRNIAH